MLESRYEILFIDIPSSVGLFVPLHEPYELIIIGSHTIPPWRREREPE